MATFVTLYKFTDQGLKNIKDTVKRAETAKKTAAAAGIQVRETLWLQGQYDVMAISDAPDEMAGTALALNTARHGNVHSVTMRAFTAAEMEKILAKLE